MITYSIPAVSRRVATFFMSMSCVSGQFPFLLVIPAVICQHRKVNVDTLLAAWMGDSGTHC